MRRPTPRPRLEWVLAPNGFIYRSRLYDIGRVDENIRRNRGVNLAAKGIHILKSLKNKSLWTRERFSGTIFWSTADFLAFFTYLRLTSISDPVKKPFGARR